MMDIKRPLRLVLMSIESDEAAAAARSVHRSFEEIPGVRCLTAVGRARTVGAVPSKFNHVTVFEFADDTARDRYHEHPIHSAARADFRAHVSAVVVIDLD